MSATDFIKRQRELLAQQQDEIKERFSPMLKGYWSEFVDKGVQLGVMRQEHKAQQNRLERQTERPKPIAMSNAALQLHTSLQEKIGEEIYVSDWVSVDQSRIDRFAEVTEDQQWIHTDPERAQVESPFKTTVAHGFLTLSLLPLLTGSVDPEKPQYPTAKMAVNYGLNQVRFPYPVKVGSKVRGHTRLLSVTPIPRGLELVKEVTVKIDGTRRPACVAETVVRLYL